MTFVIVNPESAGGATREAWPGIASDLRSHLGPFTLAFTQKSGEAGLLAATAARKGERLIVACGGDGTISEVANGILQSDRDTELGILPSGTGGDFRRTLGVPARIPDAVRILRDGQTRKIDVGRVTFVGYENEHDTRYFLGVASFGMSAAVIKRAKACVDWLPGSGSGWLPSRLSYGVSTLQTAMRSQPIRVAVQIDDGPERHLTVTNLCVANARYFGGGMKIAPQAKLTDGRLDVISIGELGLLKILANAPRIYLGSHLGMEQVSHALASKVVARPEGKNTEVAIEVDGELPGRLPATFQVVPQALRVRCPKFT